MKLGTILTACDLNPLYSEFIPNFIRAWNILFPLADVVIVLIADEIPDNLKQYEKNLRLFKPLPNIHTAFQAQCIRLLYPRLIERNEGVLITDMDMLPMNRSYYIDAIQNISDDTFVTYRDVCLPTEIAMCYNIATPKVWQEIFGNASTESILQSWYMSTIYDGQHGGKGWGTDQQILLKKFNSWNGPKITLNDSITKFRRLDRGSTDFYNLVELNKNIKLGNYSDYHCWRPYSQYKGINDSIVNLLEFEDIKLQTDLVIGLGDSYETIEIPTIKTHTLDKCYAHALLDRVFVWYWLISDLKNKYPEFTHFNLLVGKDLIEQFPGNLDMIDEVNHCYKYVWGYLSKLIPNTTILFEHLINPTKFKYLFITPYHDKWQRTPWNSEIYYPGRNVPLNEVRFSDEVIYSKLQSFREMVLQKYEITPTNNLIIIDRKHDRKFDKDMLNALILEANKNTNWTFDGVKILEDMSFDEQVRLFASTKIIICIHGSSLINLLWAQKNSIIFEIDIETHRSKMYKRISKLTDSRHYYLHDKTLSIQTDIMNKLNSDIDSFILENNINIGEGFSRQVPSQVNDLIKLISNGNLKSVLEIGFNAGHSADTFLSHNKNIKLLSFDLGAHEYGQKCKEYIDSMYPNRHNLILGDSTITIPKFIEEHPNETFDLIYIDGGHEYHIAKADMENCMKLAHKDTIVVLDDTIFDGRFATWNIGPTQVWFEFLGSNKIIELDRKTYEFARGMAWGKYCV